MTQQTSRGLRSLTKTDRLESGTSGNGAARLLAAAAHLVDLLAEENAALAASDIPRAVTLVEAKAAALAALQAMLPIASPDRSLGGKADHAAAEALSRRLQEEMMANQKLLERAIHVQGRIIGMIARAVPRAMAANAPRYGAKGSVHTQHLRQPIAVSSRA